MGWSFRRSARFGPFGLNFSKSGIGVSTGVRGARISTGPRGTYINLGTSGLYYRQKIGGRYSAGSGAAGTASTVNNGTPHQPTSLPSGLNYPVFPKHGPPRIVTTLGLMGILGIAILPWIIAFADIGTSSRSFSGTSRNINSTSVTEKEVNKPPKSSREKGFRAGFDYAVRTQGATSGKKLEQRRVKQLAAQMAASEQEDTEWQQAWIEGYTRGSDRSIGSNAKHNGVTQDQSTPSETAPITAQQFPRSNRYIRGPRGGCYYLSVSGRKVYVDRGLCN